jgi:hypothetical protein
MSCHSPVRSSTTVHQVTPTILRTPTNLSRGLMRSPLSRKSSIESGICTPPQQLDLLFELEIDDLVLGTEVKKANQTIKTASTIYQIKTYAKLYRLTNTIKLYKLSEPQ